MMSTFKGQNDMLTELLKSNMVKNDISSIKKIQKRLKERVDELVKENKFHCAQLPSIDEVARKKFGMLHIREEELRELSPIR